MPHTNLSFATADGICPATVFTPEHQSAPFSVVIFYYAVQIIPASVLRLQSAIGLS